MNPRVDSGKKYPHSDKILLQTVNGKKWLKFYGVFYIVKTQNMHIKSIRFNSWTIGDKFCNLLMIY